MWLAGLHARPWPAASTLSGGKGGEIDRRLARVTTSPWSASYSLSLFLSLSLSWCCSLRCGFPVPVEREQARERDREEEHWGKGAGIGKGSGCKPTQPQHTHMHTHTVFSTPASLVGGEGGRDCCAAQRSHVQVRSSSFTSQTHSRGSAAKWWHPCRWNQGDRESEHKDHMVGGGGFGVIWKTTEQNYIFWDIKKLFYQWWQWDHSPESFRCLALF